MIANESGRKSCISSAEFNDNYNHITIDDNIANSAIKIPMIQVARRSTCTSQDHIKNPTPNPIES